MVPAPSSGLGRIWSPGFIFGLPTPVRRLGILASLFCPSLIDAHSGKAWLRRMRFFTLLGRTLARMMLFKLLVSHCRRCCMVLHWLEKKLLLFGLWSLPGSHGRSKRWVGWQQRLLDACITMIAEADGDSTPPGQRLLCVLPIVKRL